MAKNVEFWESINSLASVASSYPGPDNLRLLRDKIYEADAYYSDDYLGNYCRSAIRHLNDALSYKRADKIKDSVELACDRVVRIQDGLRVAERRRQGLPDALE